MEYTTPHMPQLNRVIERRFTVIKEGALAMLMNTKLNHTSQKTLETEAVRTCERVQNSMATRLEFLWRETETYWFVIRVWTYCLRY